MSRSRLRGVGLGRAALFIVGEGRGAGPSHELPALVDELSALLTSSCGATLFVDAE